jgi:MFS family permease
MSTPLSAFRSRDFRLLWLGNLVSLTGGEMTRTAVSWQILELSGGDPLALGMIGAARLIPMVALALGSGVLADAFDRRKLMMGAQVLMMLTSLALALITSLSLSALWLIYLLTALASAAMTINQPARTALIPSLVPGEHLAGALSLNIMAWQLASVFGPTAAGVVIQAAGVGAVYWLDVASFSAILVSLLLMKSREVPGRPRSVTLAAAIEGLTFVRRHKLIFNTMLLDFLATFFGAATVLLPIYAQDILAVGPQGLGLLYAAPSIGAVTASVVTSVIGIGRRQGLLLMWAVIIYGLSTAVFGLSTNFWLSVAMLALNGASDTISMVVRHNIRNLETPDELRGRTTAVNMLFFSGGPQLGEIEAGVAARLLGVPLSVAAGGVACAVMSWWLSMRTPELISYRDGRHRRESVQVTG